MRARIFCAYLVNKRWIKCILCTPRPIYRLTYRPTLDRCIGRHIGRVSSVECRAICRSTYRSILGRYVDRDMSVDLSTDVYRPSDGRHIDRLSADISVDVSADTLTIDCRRSIGRRSVVYGRVKNLDCQ